MRSTYESIYKTIFQSTYGDSELEAFHPLSLVRTTLFHLLLIIQKITLNLKRKNWQTLSFAHSHNNDGVTHFLQGNYKAAEQAFKLSYQMDPNLSIAYNNLSYLYTCSGHLEKALELVDKGLEISPKNSALYLQKGLIYLSQEQFDDALHELEQSYKLNPKNHHCILLIGDCNFLSHNVKAAYDYWKQACENPIYLYFVSQRTRYLHQPDLTPENWLLPQSDTLFAGK